MQSTPFSALVKKPFNSAPPYLLILRRSSARTDLRFSFSFNTFSDKRYCIYRCITDMECFRRRIKRCFAQRLYSFSDENIASLYWEMWYFLEICTPSVKRHYKMCDNNNTRNYTYHVTSDIRTMNNSEYCLDSTEFMFIMLDCYWPKFSEQWATLLLRNRVVSDLNPRK